MNAKKSFEFKWRKNESPETEEKVQADIFRKAAFAGYTIGWVNFSEFEIAVCVSCKM